MSHILDRLRGTLPNKRPTRRVSLTLIVVAGFMVFGSSAWAYWTTFGAGIASATTGTLNAPTSVVASSTAGSRTVHLTWTASTGATVPSGYFVTQSSDTASGCGTPSAPIAATSCDALAAADGEYSYIVTAVYGSWTATSAASNDVTVSSVSPAVKVAFTVEPSDTVGGSAITPPVAVTIQDASNVAVPVAGTSVTVEIATNPALGTITGTVTATTNTSGVATFSGLSINNSGTGYTLRATSGTLASATSSTFNITKRSQSITLTSTAPGGAVVDGDTYAVVATGGGSGNPVTFSSATTSVCTVSGSTVSFVGAGTCTINANQAGSSNYYEASEAAQTFSVDKTSQTIAFTSNAPGGAAVGGGTYNVVATASSGLTVAFSSATTSVCTVAGSTVTFVGAGSCTINADQAGTANYNAAPRVQQAVTVAKGSQTITFTSNAPGGAVVAGSAYSVAATASSGLTVAFSSATPSVCSLAGSTVTFIATGSCTINANQAGTANYNAAAQVGQSFAVAKGSQTITFTSTAPTSATVGGSTYTVTATGGGSGSPVTFTSATTSVCTLSGSTVTFVGAGTCTVNANQGGTANYNAASQAAQTFAVGKISQTVTFTSSAPSGATVGGSTYSVTATGGGSGNPVIFTSATTSVCTVSGSTVTFVGAGTCTINANQAGNSNYNAAPQAQQPISVSSAPLAIATVVRDGGNKKVHFTGTNAAATTTITVTICATNSFPCASPVTTATATSPTSGGWTSGQTALNLNPSQTYFAQAGQGAVLSSIFTFSTTGL